MEEWQKKHIQANLSVLIQDIHCNPDLLAILRQNGVLGEVDVERIDARRYAEGFSSQSLLLLTVLQTRTRGYEHLTKALERCRQTGALSVLLNGFKENIWGIPVIFGGPCVPLDTLLKPDQQENLSSFIDTFYDEYLESGKIILTRDTIPEKLTYLVSRSLTHGNKLKLEFFQELSQDIFLIEGIERHKLTKLAEWATPQSIFVSWVTQLTDVSSSQRKRQTVRFIVLENQHHFEEISLKTHPKPVHWIKYENDNYFYVKSNGVRKVSDIKIYLENTKHQVTEDQFMKTVSSRQSNFPTLIYDTPGMGKSILLANIARRMKEEHPERSVIFLEFKELVAEIAECGITATADFFYEFLIKKVTVSDFGKTVLREISKHSNHHIELFIDGYDELILEHKTTALDLLECIQEDCYNISLYITSRPHRGEELENILNVVGHRIFPLDTSNQILLFERYWELECKVEMTENIKNIASMCISDFQVFMNTEDDDNVAGIPLQCKMLAELHLARVRDEYSTSNQPQIRINSLYDMYKEYVENKLAIITNKTKRESIFDHHVRLAISTIFPDYNFQACDEISHEEMCQLGIVETGFKDTLKFIHRTYAEFFIAELSLTILYGNNSSVMTNEIFLPFFFDQVLLACEENLFVGCHIKDNTTFTSLRFQQLGITFFLNSGLSKVTLGFRFESILSLLQSSSYFSHRRFIILLWGSLADNLRHLFTLFISLYSSNEQEDVIVNNENEINHRLLICLGSRITNLDSRILEAGEGEDGLIRYLPNLVLASVSFSNVELVEFSLVLVTSLSNLNISELPYEQSKTPLHVAVQRGNYGIAELFYNLYRDTLSSHKLLLHQCLFQSADERASIIKDKIRILNILIDSHPELLDRTDYANYNAPILTQYIHFDLLRLLIERGVKVLARDRTGANVAHSVTTYFSPDDYHKFVELMIKKDLCDIFESTDSLGDTPIHHALKNIELKSETIQLLNTCSHVNFNTKNGKGSTTLIAAIEGSRSLHVLEQILNFGGDPEVKNGVGHTVLCVSLMSNNIAAFEYFLSLGISEHGRCCLKAENLLFHAIESREDVRHKAVQILLRRNVNVNAVIYLGNNERYQFYLKIKLFPFRTPLSIAYFNQVDSRTIAMLTGAGGNTYNIWAIVLNSIVLFDTCKKTRDFFRGLRMFLNYLLPRPVFCSMFFNVINRQVVLFRQIGYIRRISP